MIKAIVLDIGGVLLRTEDRKPRQKLEKQHGLQPGEAEALVFKSTEAQASTIGLIEPDRIWQNVAQILSLSPQEREDFERTFWQGDQVDQSIIQFLEELRSKYTVVLLSNAWVDARRTFAEKYGIKEGETVDQILISSELGVAKPNPIIYEMLAESLEYEYDEMLFVDDFIENIQSARALGIHIIHYRPGMDLINEIKSSLDKFK